MSSHCSSSIPSLWDELCRNQCSSFPHYEQPEMRGRRGERDTGRKREYEEKKESFPANADMTEALKSLIKTMRLQGPLKRVLAAPGQSIITHCPTQIQRSQPSVLTQTDGSS